MGNVATWGYFCIVAGLLLMRVSRWFHGDAFISGVGYLITGLAIVVALAGVGCGIAGLITQLEKPVYSIVAIFACGIISLLMVSSLFIFTGEGETIANENAEDEGAAAIPDDIHFFTLERIARSGRADLMETLLSEDAMIHSLNFEGNVVPISVAFARHPNDAGKVLLDAAEYDHWEIVQMLVDFGRRHNLPGLSPARAYSKAETIAEVDELLRRFPEQPIPDNTLSDAIANGKLELLTFMLEHGARPIAFHFEGAIRFEQGACFDLLVEHNVNEVNIRLILRNARRDTQDPAKKQFISQLMQRHGA